ncbi:MAG: hypothetical protein AB2L26_08365 [Ignavibacteria bacterium]
MIDVKEILKLKAEIVNGRHLSARGFKSVSIDSRKTAREILFIGIKGENNDGHKYIKELARNGRIKAAVVNKSWFEKEGKSIKGCAFIIVKDTVKTLGELALIHRDEMNVPIAAIAGSNGKTTTKDLAAAVLSGKFKTALY